MSSISFIRNRIHLLFVHYNNFIGVRFFVGVVCTIYSSSIGILLKRYTTFIWMCKFILVYTAGSWGCAIQVLVLVHSTLGIQILFGHRSQTSRIVPSLEDHSLSLSLSFPLLQVPGIPAAVKLSETTSLAVS